MVLRYNTLIHEAISTWTPFKKMFLLVKQKPHYNEVPVSVTANILK